MNREPEVANAGKTDLEYTRLDQGSAAAVREQLVLRLRSFQERLNRLAERVRSQRSAPVAEPTIEPGVTGTGEPAERTDGPTHVHEGRTPRQPRLPSVRALRRHGV